MAALENDKAKRLRVGVEAAAPRDPPGWLSRLVLGVSLVVICAVHGPLIGYASFANVDEAYAGALAERLLEGFKLYDGAVSQRGPLMYYAYEAIAWLHGWDNVVALRLWALAFSLAHLLLVAWMARVLLGRWAAVVATVLTGYALSFGFVGFDAYALHGETLQLPALLTATLLGAVAMHRGSSRSRWLAAAGLLFGVAASIKQSVLLQPAALLVWLFVDMHRRRMPLRTVAADVAALVLASLVVPGVFCANALREGTLHQLVYYCFTYNRGVHLQPAQTRPWLPNLLLRLGDQTSFFLLLTALAASAAPYVVRRLRAARRERSAWALVRGFGVMQYLALNLVIALASGALMLRFFPHYFLQAWPYAALCAGAAVAPVARGRRWTRLARRAVVAFTTFTLLCGWAATLCAEKVDGRLMYDRTVDDVARVIAATTSRDDRIFVWGFSPWLYQLSHRRPAGRYVFETYVTGVVPWFWDTPGIESARVVPGSVDALLADLDREKPAIVVDAGTVMLARSMRAYAPFSEWLHAGYCFDVRVGGFDVYRRTAPGVPCPVPWFPRLGPPVDWVGKTLDVPMPPVADEALTRPLPQGPWGKAIWFKHEPRPPGVDALEDPRRRAQEVRERHDGLQVEDVDWDDAAW